jgi:ATP-binding cassette subfamily F protein 3
MPLASFHNLSIYYGAHRILHDVSWGIDTGHHVGLIGANGAGKTTMLKLLTGELSPDEGDLPRQTGIAIGYLTQDPQFTLCNTVLEEAIEGLDRIHTLEAQLRKTEQDMEAAQSDSEEAGRLLIRYGRLQEEYEQVGGYAYHHRAEAVLHGLGFSDADLSLSVKVLSGGQKTRLSLAKLLLSDADLLLLDEPESHLDMAATEWLEHYINNYAGAVLLVSHDRYFLDRTVNQIVELEDQTIQRYEGNYSGFLTLKAEQIKTQQRLHTQQQKMIRHNEDFIRRNIAGQKTKQAQGRRQQLERLTRIDLPKAARRAAGLTFTSMNRSGEEVLILDQITKCYDNRILFTDLSLIIRRGERVGLIGPNGIGKTTLLRLILNQESATDGTVQIGASVEIGYYDQERISLTHDRSVLNELWSVKPSMNEETVRSILGRFLFSEDDVFKQVGQLSGGEQARLALAKLMLKEPNFLILDEPTNHLDIQSRQALEQALATYPGAMLVVSHDRYFLDRVVDELLVFEPDSVSRWPGNYSSYRTFKEEQAAAEQTLPNKTAGTKRRPTAPSAFKRKKQEKTAEMIETAIHNKEAELAQLELDLNDERIFTDQTKIIDIGNAYSKVKKDLEALYMDWEVVTMEIEGP